MRPVFDYGDEVRVMRNVRNDGTYPGLDMGAPLVKRGSVGYVQSVGTYLQDYIIYGVHFLQEDILVGCREEELILASEPWVKSEFEFRDKVQAKIKLAVNGEVLVEEFDQGEVLKVLRDMPNGVHYHVRFPGRTLLVPEKALCIIED
ncbi:nitrogen fixation protein NifZ [Kaarinaea lacus]